MKASMNIAYCSHSMNVIFSHTVEKQTLRVSFISINKHTEQISAFVHL